MRVLVCEICGCTIEEAPLCRTYGPDGYPNPLTEHGAFVKVERGDDAPSVEDAWWGSLGDDEGHTDWRSPDFFGPEDDLL